jgi:uncharacterized protein (TIGR02996 family)
MHPEADAFLDAIFDNPDDDTPRLVYADWLQEHGQEDYAQFIRLSIEMERGTHSSVQSKQLKSKRRPYWKRIVAVRHDAYRYTPIVQNDYQRGFCGAVTIHGDLFLRTVESWWPAITPHELTVFGMRGFGTRGSETEIVIAIAQHLPWLQRLRCLSRPDRYSHESVFPPLNGSVFAALGKPKLLPRLQSLEVVIATADRAALRVFAESELTTRLRRLAVEIRLPNAEETERISVEAEQSPDAIRLAVVGFLAGH